MKASGILLLRSGLIDALYDSFGQAVQEAVRKIRREQLVMDGDGTIVILVYFTDGTTSQAMVPAGL